MSTEMQMSIAASSMFPGFRFSPTDGELISYYLKKKLDGAEKCVEVIQEIEIWKHEPWDLPAKSIIQSEDEWFFFSPRGKKYPNGSQSKRATESGYWKATGKERSVKSSSNVIGTKRTLVFHMGRAPKGERTEWIMHEYCMNGKSQDGLVVCRLRKNKEFHLNDTTRQCSRRQFSTSDNNFAVSEVGVDQSVISCGAKTGECSKECSSSNNSHSVEQHIDSGSESDHRLLDESSHPDSSSPFKDREDDDCFADIMKDDIIKLDDSSLHIAHNHLSVVSLNPEAKGNSKQPTQATVTSVLPFQGTANRRIRFRRQRTSVIQVEPSEKSEIWNEINHNTRDVVPADSENTAKDLTRLGLKRRLALQFVSAFFVMLTLVVLYLSSLRGSNKSKGSIMASSKWWVM